MSSHFLWFHIPIKFISYERKEASVGVTNVASSTAGTTVFFKKRNSTKSWWFLRPSNFKVGSGPVIWRLISHCYCGAMTWVTLPWSSTCMASGLGWSTSHMLANRSILSNIEEQGNRVVLYHCWLVLKKSITADLYLFFYFWWMLAFQLFTTKGAKHGMCWMSHTSVKGVGHEHRGRAQRKKQQRGRASPLLPLLGRRPHVVVLVVSVYVCVWVRACTITTSYYCSF